MEGFIIVNKEKDLPINGQIRADYLMVIGPRGEQMGVKSKQDALTLAEYAGFDLVMINPTSNPPVCKILDYNKYKYEKRKKTKDALKKQRETSSEIKEFRLSVNIDKHDFDTRVTNVTKNLEKGNRIKISIRFKGREMAHTDLGMNVMNRFAEALSDIAEVESKPKLEGRTMIMMIVPKKKQEEQYMPKMKTHKGT